MRSVRGERIVRLQMTLKGLRFFDDEVSHEKRVRKNLMIDYTMYIT